MIQGFIEGVTAYIQAIRIISQYKLWGYIIAPCLISLFFAFVILGTAWTFADNIGDWLIRFYPWSWGKSILEKIISIFGGLFIGVFGFIIFKQVIMALASPFMSPLSEKVENVLSGKHVDIPFSLPRFIRELTRGITIAIRNIILELFFTLILFLIGLIPVFTPFTSFLIFIIQAYYAGFGNLDFLLERHFNVSQSIRFVRKNSGLSIGNGMIFLLLFLTGIGFLVALPLGTVAAAYSGSKKL